MHTTVRTMNHCTGIQRIKHTTTCQRLLRTSSPPDPLKQLARIYWTLYRTYVSCHTWQYIARISRTTCRSYCKYHVLYVSTYFLSTYYSKGLLSDRRRVGGVVNVVRTKVGSAVNKNKMLIQRGVTLEWTSKVKVCDNLQAIKKTKQNLMFKNCGNWRTYQ